jgi:cyclomaltodextrinase / maltogenic alpha-amylase / neopullulanase
MRSLLPILAVLCFGHAAADAQGMVEFDTVGGDAWTFALPISGRFAPGQCDSVAIESPRARIEALRIDDRFFAEVPLLAGRNELRAVCSYDNRERVRSTPEVWRARLDDVPSARARVRTDATSIHLDGGHSGAAPALNAPLTKFEWRARTGNPATLHTLDGKEFGTSPVPFGKHVQLATPTSDGEYYVSLRVTDAIGRVDESAAVFRVVGGKPNTVDLRSEHPAWVDSAVLYGAAPYMFEPQNLRGIEERLDEIAALGATAIWLSPVTAAAPDDFGYAVVDQFSIREGFGGTSALRSLIEAAHRQGLRVLVDFVPNHFSQFHTYFADAEQNGQRSPYFDWFDRDANGDVTQYFDWQHLKNLNFDNPAVRNHIIAAAARFVREFDVDGFRVDASWAVAQRAPEFWPELRAELKRIDPDIVLIAEASAREDYHVQNGFDAAYDWTQNLGEWAWRDVFRSNGTADLDRLRVALTNDGRGFPPDSLVLRFINNNDTGERFVTRFGEHTARLAAALVFTLPGIPLIYNGDEIGAAFEPYDEGPPIRWQDTALTDHYRKLAFLRRSNRALSTRELIVLKTTDPDSVLAYQRPGTSTSESVLVLLNFSDTPHTVKGADRPSRLILESVGAATDLLSGSQVRVNNNSLRVPAKSALILRRQPPR